MGDSEAGLVFGRLSSAESIAKPTVKSWFRFLFEDDMETLRVSLLFHAREKMRGKMVMRIETKDTQERLRKEI